jgi:hypothetical protein
MTKMQEEKEKEKEKKRRRRAGPKTFREEQQQPHQLFQIPIRELVRRNDHLQKSKKAKKRKMSGTQQA